MKTPITDAAKTDGWSGDAFAVPVEVAEQLERRALIAEAKANGSLANNLCSDHRDKLGSKS